MFKEGRMQVRESLCMFNYYHRYKKQREILDRSPSLDLTNRTSHEVPQHLEAYQYGAVIGSTVYSKTFIDASSTTWVLNCC